MKRIFPLLIATLTASLLFSSCSAKAKTLETETLETESMTEDHEGSAAMSYDPFSLLTIAGDYTLTAEAGFRSDFFESYECQSTGDMLDAIARYILRVNDVDTSEFEFDSETGAFVMRSDDEEDVRKAAEILTREINRDEVLIAAMESDEVREELELSRKISDIVSKIMSESEEPLSAEEFLEQFNALYTDD